MGHYKMRARVFVHTQDEFNAWSTQQAAGGTE
jgi:heme/copper-type cytochrome/quinol oxidase subunit 2